MIHRDVKPSNILVTEREFVYLIDFGLARTAGEKGLTTAGSTLGTMAYMAPERFEGKPVDPTSDIYALTCVLYECLTGVRPYPAESLEQQIAGHMTKAIPRPSAIDPRLAAFDEVIAKGMAKNPAKRYQTAGELAEAARRALNAPVRTAGSGRHSARRAPAAKRRVSPRCAGGGGGRWCWWPHSARSGYCSGGADPGGMTRGRRAWRRVRRRQTPTAAPGAVESIAATVPDDIKATGQLIIGVNVPYAPNEFKDANGEIVGFDVDLMNAIARTLGLTPQYRETAFEAIFPSVRAEDFNVGMSSFTDTKEREEQVDFVTYFEAGTLWAQQAGSGVDPANACGLRVGVTYASIQETVEIPDKSEDCVAAGMAPIEKVVYVSQDDLNAALTNGEVAAMSADSPVTGFTVKTSGGALEAAGEVSDPQPYGWPVAKGSALAESLRQALEHLMRDRGIPDHRHHVGRREGHDRQTGDQRCDRMSASGS